MPCSTGSQFQFQQGKAANYLCAAGGAVTKANIAAISRPVVVSLATLIVVRSRSVARRPSGLEEPSANLVVRPGHAAVLPPLVLTPTARRFVDRDVECAGGAGDAAEESGTGCELDQVLYASSLSARRFF